MSAGSDGTLHTHAAVWTGQDWRIAAVASGLRIKEMERVGDDIWRVYTTRDGEPGVNVFTIDATLRWEPAGRIQTPKPVQRVELVTHGRAPAPLPASGASRPRPGDRPDGDIYVLP